MIAGSRKGIRLTALAALTVMLQSQSSVADNKIVLKKDSDDHIAIELTNSDPVAGFQFSVNGRGGFTFGAYTGTERTMAAGLGIYQYLANDSTLNVVILAPVRSSLPFGTGIIGKIAYSIDKRTNADTARVFLSRVVLCNADAQYLDVATTPVEWALRAPAGSQQAAFALEQNYPNPFNPSTTISYRLDAPSTVQLAVYDITGRQIEVLVNQYQEVGRYSVRWNADVRVGSRLASGMYFARLQVGDKVAVEKMILAK